VNMTPGGGVDCPTWSCPQHLAGPQTECLPQSTPARRTMAHVWKRPVERVDSLGGRGEWWPNGSCLGMDFLRDGGLRGGRFSFWSVMLPRISLISSLFGFLLKSNRLYEWTKPGRSRNDANEMNIVSPPGLFEFDFSIPSFDPKRLRGGD